MFEQRKQYSFQGALRQTDSEKENARDNYLNYVQAIIEDEYS